MLLMTGECVIWTGVFLASAHVLNTVPIYPPWFGYTMIVSPLFTIYTLTKVFHASSENLIQISGIPPLERQMNKRLRGRKDYEEYKKNTPILIPKL
jgi:steroid 5-alpha reductase family enzyme